MAQLRYRAKPNLTDSSVPKAEVVTSFFLSQLRAGHELKEWVERPATH